MDATLACLGGLAAQLRQNPPMRKSCCWHRVRKLPNLGFLESARSSGRRPGTVLFARALDPLALVLSHAWAPSCCTDIAIERHAIWYGRVGCVHLLKGPALTLWEMCGPQ